MVATKNAHIKTGAWQCIGTMRKPHTSITWEALDWNPQKAGKPFQSWKRTRMKELETIGKTWGEAKRIAQTELDGKQL